MILNQYYPTTTCVLRKSLSFNFKTFCLTWKWCDVNNLQQYEKWFAASFHFAQLQAVDKMTWTSYNTNTKCTSSLGGYYGTWGSHMELTQHIISQLWNNHHLQSYKRGRLINDQLLVRNTDKHAVWQQEESLKNNRGMWQSQKSEHLQRGTSCDTVRRHDICYHTALRHHWKMLNHFVHSL